MEGLEKEFVPYELSLKMKQLGFDELCFGMFFPSDKSWKDIKFKNSQQDNIIASPTYSQAFRWFREKYNLDSRFHTYTHHIDGKRTDYMYDFIDGKKTSFDGFEKTREEAELACLIKLIEIIEQKQKENANKI